MGAKQKDRFSRAAKSVAAATLFAAFEVATGKVTAAL
jgi:hypothetical protein